MVQILSAGDTDRPSSSYELTVCAKEEEDAPPYESKCDASFGKDYAPGVPPRMCNEWFQDCAYNGARPVYFGHKPKNIILFGETGVGKSSVINLLAGAEVATTSSNLEGCTLQAMEYTFTLPGATSLRIFDTVGLEEPEMGINTFLGAIEKAHQLVTSLKNAGGVDLLLFCIRAGRITVATQRNYRLFFEVLCESQVPLAIVVTNLENEAIMEDWWVRNEGTLRRYNIRCVAHACITAVSDRVAIYTQKRAESQKALRIMLLGALSVVPTTSYVQDTRSWLVVIIDLLRSFLTRKESLKKADLLKKFERDCMLPRSDAEKLASRFI